MRSPIGYYVHHHGDGHRQRALAICNAAPDRFVMIGTGLAGRTGDIACIDLADDRANSTGPFDGVDRERNKPHAFHFAPLHREGTRKRAAQLTGWISEVRPRLLVVDVSVEIALLARLASTPVVYVRLTGERNDIPHSEAFRSAVALLSPFHEDLDDPSCEAWVRAKTRYCAGLTQSGLKSEMPAAGSVLVVQGNGGQVADGEQIAQAARSISWLKWRVIGSVSPPEHTPENLTLLGWVDNPAIEFRNAGVVIGAAGDGLVSAVMSAGRPFICIWQPRPFREQALKAQRLAALGAAIALDSWPTSANWPAVLQAAETIRPQVQYRLHCERGPASAAQFLTQLADQGCTCVDN
ncbi:MAG: glycosyltransferase [Caulobacterales bacterium]